MEEIDCQPVDGTAYTGTISITKDGFTCQKWSEDTPQEHNYNDVGEHNYCRNPSASAGGYWCYTTDKNKRFDWCIIPSCGIQTQSAKDIGCNPTDGTSYTGMANSTKSGKRTCQMWSVNTPHEHKFNDVGEHNYCRSPDGSGELWCYTTDVNERWELCDVPLCGVTGTLHTVHLRFE